MPIFIPTLNINFSDPKITNMKRILSVLSGLFLCLTVFSVQAQVYQSNNSEQIPLRYEGGDLAFLQDIFPLLEYPRSARQSCEMGQLFVEIQFDDNGQPIVIKLLNELTPALNRAVTDAIGSLNKKKWKPVSLNTPLIISFGFKMEDVDIKGDVMVGVTSVVGPASDCKSSEKLETDMRKAKEKGKIRKAYKLCKELIMRHPNNENYTAVFDELSTEMENMR